MVKKHELRVLGGLFAVILAGFGYSVSAERYTSPSYTIDASVVGNSFGGNSTSTNYTLTSSGGESIVGQGSGGSYKLDSGYVSQLTSAANSFSLRVQPSGLIGYYSFDTYAQGGVIVNEVHDASTLSSAGTTPLASGVGKIQNGLVLDGTGSYASEDTQGRYIVNAGNILTATGWFKRTRNGVNERLLYNDHGCQGWSVNLWADNRIAAIYVDGADCNSYSSKGIATTTTFTDTAWHYFAVVFNRSTGYIKIYIDGNFQSEVAGMNTTINPAAWHQMRIGADWEPKDYFQGTMDEVKLFSRELSASEIKAEYNAQNVGIASGLSLGTIIPNTPNTTLFDSIVQTAANGYSLAIHQNANLTSGSNTIPAISPTIAAPAAWADGSTKGLGFTLTATNATALDSKWNSGSAYAAIPTASASTIYVRTGVPITKDIITARLRADVASSQPVGEYSNVVTVTGTYTP